MWRYTKVPSCACCKEKNQNDLTESLHLNLDFYSRMRNFTLALLLLLTFAYIRFLHIMTLMIILECNSTHNNYHMSQKNCTKFLQ